MSCFSPLRWLVLALSLGALGAEAADPAPFPPDPKLVNLAPLGLAQAECCPFGTDPNLALQGQGVWCNTGRDPNVRDHELIPRAQVNKAFPSWFIIVWPVEVSPGASGHDWLFGGWPAIVSGSGPLLKGFADRRGKRRGKLLKGASHEQQAAEQPAVDRLPVLRAGK